MMMVIGMCLGVALWSEQGKESGPRSLTTLSLSQWVQIDPRLILFIFLPALIYESAMETNYYIFSKHFFSALAKHAFERLRDLDGRCLPGQGCWLRARSLHAALSTSCRTAGTGQSLFSSAASSLPRTLWPSLPSSRWGPAAAWMRHQTPHHCPLQPCAESSSPYLFLSAPSSPSPRCCPTSLLHPTPHTLSSFLLCAAQELGVLPDLRVLIEAESLLNDGTAIGALPCLSARSARKAQC
eukprot:1578262-Rhodomonas_salina.1